MIVTGKTPAGVNTVAKAPLKGSAGTQKTAPANPPKVPATSMVRDAVQWVGTNKTALIVGVITAAAGAWLTLQLARR
jgi:hypothetical protein